VTKRVDTSEMRAYKEYVAKMTILQFQYLPPWMQEGFRRARFYICRYVYADRFMRLRYTDEPIAKDLTNLLKPTEDAIMKALGKNDKGVFHTVLHKVPITDESNARFAVSIGYSQSYTRNLSEIYKAMMELSSDFEWKASKSLWMP